MAPPQYRTATQTRRGARSGYPAEHDDFEGLPVRQWRQEWVNVAPPAPQETSQQNDRWAIELPYGMPKEYPLLPPHSQELLRAARSGRLYKRPAPLDDEDGDVDAEISKGDKKESDAAVDGFMVKMWKQMPRNVESPTVSHLAKRHKNTVTLASKAIATQISGPTVTRATVRRIDAAGNPYEQTVTLTAGQQVDGEIIHTTVVPAPVAAKPELAAQQPAPQRRRPPPPKRKAKGPGRGRKKGAPKLPLPVPVPAQVIPQAGAASTNETIGIKTEPVGAEPVKIEDNEDSANQDSEMADNSAIPSDDEEGDDGEDEGDDNGDEDDETPEIENSVNPDPDQDQDVEMEDSEASEVIRPSSIEEPDERSSVPAASASTSDEEVTIPKVRFAPPSGLVNLAPPLAPIHLSSPRLEGSPLKNVIIQSPTESSPVISPHAPGFFETNTSMPMEVSNPPAPVDVADVSEAAVDSSLDDIIQMDQVSGQEPVTQVDFIQLEDVAMDLTDNVPSDSGAVAAGDFSDPMLFKAEDLPREPVTTIAPESVAEPVAELVAELVADIAPEPVAEPAAEPATNTAVGAPHEVPSSEAAVPPAPGPAAAVVPDTFEIADAPPPAPVLPPIPAPEIVEAPTDIEGVLEPLPTPIEAPALPDPTPAPLVVEEPAIVEEVLQPPASPALLPAAVAEEEDDGLNLLGSLERELDRQEGMSNASSREEAANRQQAAVTDAAADTAAGAAGGGAGVSAGAAAVVNEGAVASADAATGSGEPATAGSPPE
ncbi:hypothetical protein B0T24DRAFT_54200 [Lasiosphaeria ovina]|uniref:Apopolysialoglycoprotein n=1 Tax=Lasiosphaeria ovina TaxID=92902 RepID=A0AAE0NLC8_9PEZI|nr:hypothetical protein B0T24DRAFT_54200 [Lasiosphaeria ovina]